MRSLDIRIALALHAVCELEQAADKAWERARPYFLPRPLLRSTERLDAWWELHDEASNARERLHRLLTQQREQLAEDRLDVLHAAGVPPLFSTSPEAACAKRAPSSGATAPALPPAPSRESEARTPDGYTGTPHNEAERLAPAVLEAGTTAGEAAAQLPAGQAAAPSLSRSVRVREVA